MPLVFIEPLVTGGNRFEFPTPSKYTGLTSTIVDSARNTSGQMIGSVIRHNVAKITMSWNFIDVFEWAAILQQFEPEYGGAFIREVTFFNQARAFMETRRMYVSDRTGDSFLLFNYENLPDDDLSYYMKPRGYRNATFSLVEV